MVSATEELTERLESTSSTSSADSKTTATSDGSRGSPLPALLPAFRLKRSTTSPQLGANLKKGWATAIVQRRQGGSPALDGDEDALPMSKGTKSLASLIRRVGSTGSEPSAWKKSGAFSSTMSRLISVHRSKDRELEQVMQQIGWAEKRHMKLLTMAGFPAFEAVYADSQRASEVAARAKLSGNIKIKVPGVLGKGWQQYFCALDEDEQLHVFLTKDAENSIAILAIGDCVVMKQKNTRATAFSLQNRQNSQVVDFDTPDAHTRKQWIGDLRLASYHPCKLQPRKRSAESAVTSRSFDSFQESLNPGTLEPLNP